MPLSLLANKGTSCQGERAFPPASRKSISSAIVTLKRLTSRIPKKMRKSAVRGAPTSKVRVIGDISTISARVKIGVHCGRRDMVGTCEMHKLWLELPSAAHENKKLPGLFSDRLVSRLPLLPWPSCRFANMGILGLVDL